MENELTAEKLEALLQAEADKKRQKKECLKKQFELSKTSLKKAMSTWRLTMKDIKIKELQCEAAYWTIKAEDMFRKKDNVIKLKIQELEIFGKIHQKDLRYYVGFLEYMLGSYRILQHSVKLLYEFYASEMLARYYKEILYKAASTGTFFNEIHNTNTSHMSEEYYSTFVKKQHIDKEYVKSRKRNVRHSIVNKMNFLQNQFLDFVAKFRVDVIFKLRNSVMLKLDKNPDGLEFATNELNKEEHKTTNKLINLEKELLETELKVAKAKKGLELEKKFLFEILHEKRKTIYSDRNRIEELLQTNTSSSEKIIKKFKEYQVHGEHLLAMCVCCRKYQPKNDTIFPFGLCGDIGKPFDMTDEELHLKLGLFKNFWKRVTVLQNENLTLLKEKKKLTEENEKYRKKIKPITYNIIDEY